MASKSTGPVGAASTSTERRDMSTTGNKSSIDKEGYQTPGRRNTRRLTEKERAKVAEVTGMQVDDESSTDEEDNEREEEEEVITINASKTQYSATGQPE